MFLVEMFLNFSFLDFCLLLAFKAWRENYIEMTDAKYRIV